MYFVVPSFLFLSMAFYLGSFEDGHYRKKHDQDGYRKRHFLPPAPWLVDRLSILGVDAAKIIGNGSGTRIVDKHRQTFVQCLGYSFGGKGCVLILM